MTVLFVILLQIGVGLYFAFRNSDGGWIAGLQALGQRLIAVLVSSPAIWVLGSGVLVFLWIGSTASTSMENPFSGGSQAMPDMAARITALSAAAIEGLILLLVILAKVFGGVLGGGPDFVFGSARFATPAHADDMGLLGATGIRLGYLRHPDPKIRAKEAEEGVRRPVHYTGQRHLLTVAPTRAGKGVSTIIPNLLTYPGSAIIIDPKGENATITYDRRAAIGRSFALDPWGITGKPVARFNPLDLLTADSPTLIEDALLIADALVVHEGGDSSFWADEARALIMGFLLHIATSPTEAETRTLGRLRDILTSTPDELADVGLAMAESDHPVVVSSAARLISKSENERSGVMSTAQQNTHFLESPALRENLAASDFRFADLKGDTPASVYIVLPVDRLTTYNRWLRMLIALGIADLARNPAKPARPVLFMLDEFAQLGRLKIIEDAYGLMAGLGIQLHAIVQDLSQMERLYEKGWQTFIGNAGAIQIFGTRDLHTAEYISKMIGVTTRTLRSTSSSSGQGGGSSSTSWSPTQRPLVFPDELMRMDRNAQILLIENADPVLGDKVLWYEDDEFKGLAAVAPAAKPPTPPPPSEPPSPVRSVTLEEAARLSAASRPGPGPTVARTFGTVRLTPDTARSWTPVPSASAAASDDGVRIRKLTEEAEALRRNEDRKDADE